MVDVCTPDESTVTYELGVLEELQCVFNPEMAYASYIPFCCLMGRKKLHPFSSEVSAEEYVLNSSQCSSAFCRRHGTSETCSQPSAGLAVGPGVPSKSEESRM